MRRLPIVIRIAGFPASLDKGIRMHQRTRTVLLASLALATAAGVAVTASNAEAQVSSARAATDTTPTVCTGLTAGSYDPGPSTTGLRPDSTLTTVTGDLNITAPGTYANLDVHGFVKVNAANVRIVNSRVRGGVATTSQGLIEATGAAVSNLVIEGVELVPEHPSYLLTGVLGHDYTAKCVNVYQTVDGFGIFNTHAPGGASHVNITQSFCHELAYYSPDPGHDDNKSHNDCIQIQGGSGAVITYNRLHAYYSNKVGTMNFPADHSQALSTLMLNANVGKTTDLVVTDNLLDGGEISVNGGGLTYQSTDFLGTFYRNRFDRTQYYVGHTIDLDATVRADTGDGTPNHNTYTDGSPITVRHNG
jgi:hypothetical protein